MAEKKTAMTTTNTDEPNNAGTNRAPNVWGAILGVFILINLGALFLSGIMAAIIAIWRAVL